MTPPQAQLHTEVLSSAGMFPIFTVGHPGDHGPVGTGMHGIGVSTPSAAAVAAATIGFAGDMHMPNGAMFTIGAMSIIFAAGATAFTIFAGSTVRTEGAIPKGQDI